MALFAKSLAVDCSNKVSEWSDCLLFAGVGANIFSWRECFYLLLFEALSVSVFTSCCGVQDVAVHGDVDSGGETHESADGDSNVEDGI